MADPQDPTNSAPDGTGGPPEKKPPAKAGEKAAKAPAKKAPAKKAPAKKAAAKKAPAKKAPAKKLPANIAEPKAAAPAEKSLDTQQRIETNGDLAAAAADTAAQAKSTVEAADNPVALDVAGSA